MDGWTDGCLLYGSVRVCTFVQITVCLCVWISVRFEMIARPMGVSVAIRHTTWFPVAAAVVRFIFSFFSVLQMIPSLFLVDVCFCCYCFIFVDIQYGGTLVLGRSLYSSNSLLLRLPLMLCVMISNFFDIRHLNRIKKISLIIIRMKYRQTLEWPYFQV